MTPLRILVTGSRALTDAVLVYRVLGGQWRARAVYGDLPPLTVVVGDCPTGADRIAREWARRMAASGLPVSVEVHEADWEHCAPDCRPGHRRTRRDGVEYCPTAGRRRNDDMVETGADEAHGFPLPGSRGTWDCLRKAKSAGIPVVIHEGGPAR